MNQQQVRGVVLTLGRLFDALDAVAKEARASAQWDHDTISCTRLYAKAETCEEIKAAIIAGIEQECAEPVQPVVRPPRKGGILR